VGTERIRVVSGAGPLVHLAEIECLPLLSIFPPIIGTLYVQQWALRKLTGGDLPERLRVTVTVDK